MPRCQRARGALRRRRPRPARDAGSKMHRAARAYGSTEARRAVPIYERTELPATNGVMRAAPTVRASHTVVCGTYGIKAGS